MALTCAGCGDAQFTRVPVVTPELVREWELSPEEAAYIDEQQGVRCTTCGSTLRSVVLARALLRVLGGKGPLSKVAAELPSSLGILEINEAGELTQFLRKAPGHTLACYPDVDMEALPFADGAFGLVVHSDTLEHVGDPLKGLAECRRVLRPGGALCYTVPIVVGRMSRSRSGLPASYHVSYLVHTEFGADAWTYPARAGFARVQMECLRFPAAVAITAR